jgi:2-iminobutanoate/2-iminopropanoate deaminase
MERTIVRSERAPAPVGPYSQAVVCGGLVFCSGQISPGADDIEQETRRVMENLVAVLDAAGSSLERAVKVTIFLADMGDFARVNGVYGSYFAANPPARSTIQVGALPKGARVEVECISSV